MNLFQKLFSPSCTFEDGIWEGGLCGGVVHWMLALSHAASEDGIGEGGASAGVSCCVMALISVASKDAIGASGAALRQCMYNLRNMLYIRSND